MYRRCGKRGLDVLGAGLLLLLTAPLLALAALGVLLALGRPVLFRQQRAGRASLSGAETAQHARWPGR